MTDHHDKRFWQIIFGLLLALCAVLAVILVRGEPGSFHGVPHPTKADMMIGGPALERTGSLLWLGWIFGTLQIVLFVALLALGLRRIADNRTMTRAILWVGGLIYVTAFAAVIWSYRTEITAADADVWNGFPRSSLLAIFVLWPVPYLFIANYSFGFKRFIYSGDKS